MPFRRWLKKCPLAIVLVLMSVLFPAPAWGQGGSDEPQGGVPGLDVVMLVDESETMWNHTDPEGVRVNTVNFLIDVLSTERSGARHRLGLVAFGTAPHVLPFTSLDSPAAIEELKRQYAAVHRSVGLHKDQEYTDINEALRAALAMVDQQCDPQRKLALVLVSDGQPTTPRVDERKGQEAVVAYLDETRSLLEQLGRCQYAGSLCPSANGVPLYVMGIGVDRLAETSSPEFMAIYREFWQGISARAGGYYKEARQVQEMQGISTYIFSELLCTPATPALAVRSPQVLEYQVYNNYYQIMFTISAKESPSVEATIYRPRADGKPGGTVLSKDEEGVGWQTNGIDYEVWGVTYTEPWAGTWQVVLEGEGRADFSYVVFPNVKIELYEPGGGFLAADQPFTVRAGIVDENGQPVEVPLRDFQAAIERADGFRTQVPLEKDGDTYVARLEALEQTGEYSLTLNAVLPDGTPLYEHKWVTLISAPWVEVTEPARNASYWPQEPIPLQASVHLAGATSFEDLTLVATLLKGDEPVQTIEMSRGDTLSQTRESVVAYSGTFQPTEGGGDYAVQAEMMAILPGGRVFYHEVPPIPLFIAVPPTPTPSPTPTPTPTPLPTPVPVVTITPTPVSLLALLPGRPFCLPGLLALVLLAFLLVLLVILRRRQRQRVPDKIRLLAELMHSRRESHEPPYVLVLGSGASVTLGSRSLKRVVRAIAGSDDLGKFYETLNGLSPLERYVILKKHLARACVSPGYRRLAGLVKKGYFDLIFTTNLDPFLEHALADGKLNAADFAVLICGEQGSGEIVGVLESEQPRVKIVKLHGDAKSHSFAFTPSEISLLGSESERVLRRYLDRDLIVVGHGVHDYDVNRAIEPEGGSIWYVSQSPPATDDPIYLAMQARGTPANVISGEFGLFDRFFQALYGELMRA